MPCKLAREELCRELEPTTQYTYRQVNRINPISHIPNTVDRVPDADASIHKVKTGWEIMHNLHAWLGKALHDWVKSDRPSLQL